MIAGHFGLAAGAKSVERRAPLWALMLATQWLDVVFVPLYAAKLESMEPVPGLHGGYGAYIIHANYTHSLVGAVLLSLLFGLVSTSWWGRGPGVTLGLVAFSHWVLDLIVHRGDLPILPGNLGGLPTLGFGLWRHPSASAAAELALVLAGSWLYWRAVRSVVTGHGGVGRSRANVAGAICLLAGIAVLFLDVSGRFG